MVTVAGEHQEQMRKLVVRPGYGTGVPFPRSRPTFAYENHGTHCVEGRRLFVASQTVSPLPELLLFRAFANAGSETIHAGNKEKPQGAEQ